MNITVITQARTGSSRLPSKVLKSIDGKTLLEIHIDRILKSKKVSNVIVATTINKEDDAIEKLVAGIGVSVFRGSENDVLDRFYQSVKDSKPNLIIRLTSDCPLIDPNLIDYLIDRAVANGLDYCSNTLLETFPDGQDIEVFTFEALEKSWNSAKLDSEREHVTPYIKKRSSFYGNDEFSALNISSEKEEYENVRMTVDELVDFNTIVLLIEKLGVNASWEEYAELYINSEEINSLNGNIIRNEGYLKSINKEK